MIFAEIHHREPFNFEAWEALYDPETVQKAKDVLKYAVDKLLDPVAKKSKAKGTLTIKGDKKKMKKLAKHLAKEHPSTKGKMKVLDPAPYKIKRPVSKDYIPLSDRLERQMDNAWKGKKVTLHTKHFDPIKLYQGIPAKWFEAMVKGIKNSSDVRNPYAIVKNIWLKLSPATKADIKRREAAGEQFKYNLPLPDDRVTKGEGTLRMVKPFKLAEAQVNVSKKDFEAVKKSGIFRPMKRQDGSICQVARCKGERPVNIFVDEV